MNNQLVHKFYIDLKNVLTRENLKENLRLPIYAYIVSYVIGIIAVVAIVILKPEMPGGATNLEGAMSLEKFLNTSMTWSYIITNNIKVLFTFFISGIVLYIGPVFVLGLNGFAHGLLLAGLIKEWGAIGFAKYLLLMGPHGIFELPALLFSAGAGIILSKELLNLITFRSFNKSRLYVAFYVLLIAFCLFLIASVVETQVTFRIFKVLMPTSE